MNEKPIFESERQFLLGSYAASHGLLLFRSVKTNASPTRIDVLFQDVRALDVRAWAEGLKVEISDVELLKNYPSNPAEMLETGLVVFKVSGRGWEGFIVASQRVGFKEDDLGPMDPSGLLPS
jgi:hypothetical protein